MVQHAATTLQNQTRCNTHRHAEQRGNRGFSGMMALRRQRLRVSAQGRAQRRIRAEPDRLPADLAQLSASEVAETRRPGLFGRDSGRRTAAGGHLDVGLQQDRAVYLVDPCVEHLRYPTATGEYTFGTPRGRVSTPTSTRTSNALRDGSGRIEWSGSGALTGLTMTLSSSPYTVPCRCHSEW